jgi:HEPN domain-containing protein
VIDKHKHIEYWIKNAENDIETAKILISRNRILHGLFFCHLVLEKALKAHVVKTTGEIPPKSHNLIHLAELAKIVLPEEDESFLGILMKYQLESRYPENSLQIPSREVADVYLAKTKILLKWLKEKL